MISIIFSLLRLPFAVVGGIKHVIVQSFFIAVVFSVITWSSILLYGMFYWSYIPKSSHIFPVHLHFEYGNVCFGSNRALNLSLRAQGSDALMGTTGF